MIMKEKIDLSYCRFTLLCPPCPNGTRATLRLPSFPVWTTWVFHFLPLHRLRLSLRIPLHPLLGFP